MPSHEPDIPTSREFEYNQPNEQAVHKQDHQRPTVIGPADPPGLNQAAARALLRILLAAHQRRHYPKNEEA